MFKLNAGFTLIEIIIVITIMGLLLGMGSVSYNYFSQQKSVEKDAEFIRDKINLTRERTVNRDIAANTACATFDGYELRFNRGSPQSFTVRLYCNNRTIQRDIETFNLDGSRVIPNTSFVIQFLPPYGCTNAACNAAPRTIVFENNSSTQCMNVTIDTLGKTTFSKPYVC